MLRHMMLTVVVVLAGCTAAKKNTETVKKAEPVEIEARKTLQGALDVLPACAPGADPGVLEVRPTVCTRRACQTACCNSCGWKATLQTKTGQTVPAEKERVQQALQIPDGAMECEIDAWTKLLANTSVALEPQGCMVR